MLINKLHNDVISNKLLINSAAVEQMTQID